MRKLLLLYLLFAGRLLAIDSYEVYIYGIECEETLEALYKNSQLYALRDLTPVSELALQRRAESDLPGFIKVLMAEGYYDPKIDIDLKVSGCTAIVSFIVEKGPIYYFTTCGIIPDLCFNLTEEICFSDLGIIEGDPAYPKAILDGEESLIEILEKKGFPLARINKREVIADQCAQTVAVKFYVDSGPFCYFGPTRITGLCKVRQDFFNKKIFWREGCVYDPCALVETQDYLEESGLFNAIEISHAGEADEYGRLPMEIAVIEGKQRSVATGFGYSTMRGPGLIFEWEHRNMRCLGERLLFRSNLWSLTQENTIQYTIPDFCARYQSLILQTSLIHEKTKGFSDVSFIVSGSIERRLDETTQFSYGLMYKKLHTSRSDNNRAFDLIKVPLALRWNVTDNFLDPTTGMSVTFKSIPSVQIFSPQFAYVINTLTICSYLPLVPSHRLVFASKANLGTIVGATRHAIPPSERFYAGSENNLRGYHYLTVSPLDHHHDPIGGRSMTVYSFEFRWRATETIGWVLFYDVGNVFSGYIPGFHHRLLQATGLGFRYHTPLGPLRFDVAFPLNPRKHLDNRFQVYLSIGQSF